MVTDTRTDARTTQRKRGCNFCGAETVGRLCDWCEESVSRFDRMITNREARRFIEARLREESLTGKATQVVDSTKKSRAWAERLKG